MFSNRSFLAVALSACFLAFFLASCASGAVANHDRSFPAANQVEVKAQETGILDLTMYLRQIAGVKISGEGESAEIIIRGVNSINMSTSPLFIVDDNNLGRDYRQIYAMINVEQVQRITVLKSASDTGFYGVQGANGVIKIEMKR